MTDITGNTMGHTSNPSQISGLWNGRCAAFRYDFQKGDVEHTLLIGSTRQGKCVQRVAVIAANTAGPAIVCSPEE